MRTEFVPHPCSGRVRDVPVPDSERELKTVEDFVEGFTLNPKKNLYLQAFYLEARLGIEHQLLSASNHHNSQQHKPLRSFPNVFNPLTRVL